MREGGCMTEGRGMRKRRCKREGRGMREGGVWGRRV